MPNTRILLWVALAAILYLNYESWMHDYPAPGTPGSVGQSATGASGTTGTLGDSVPQAWNTAPPPKAPATASAPVSAPPAATPAVTGSIPVPSAGSPTEPETSS